MSCYEKVAVIGAGAAGLCSARHLCGLEKGQIKQEGGHKKKIVPVVFEQSSVVGGTWVYNEKIGQDQWGLPVHSSMYKSLKTNLPKEAMAFPDFPFEDTKESFLHHSAIKGIFKKNH